MRNNLKIPKKISITILVIGVFALIHLLDLNDKMLYHLFASSSEIDIEKVKHKKQIVKIKEIKKNLSGITYSKKSDTLFAITNSPRDIYELDKNGNVLRKIELKGFDDTEDITYVKDDMFAIVDEGLSGLYIVNIFEDTKVIDIEDSIKEFVIDIRTFNNFGLEGISYDSSKDLFYLANERNPKKIITVKGLLGNSKHIETKEEFSVLDNNEYLADFAAIHFDERNKKLYVLSEESRLLGVFNGKTKDFSQYLNLTSDEVYSQLEAPEGITKDNEGNIYIVSEPNLFLSIKKE